jgi:hypothetical protein
LSTFPPAEYSRSPGGLALDPGAAEQPDVAEDPTRLVKALRAAVGADFHDGRVDDDDPEQRNGLLALVNERYAEAQPRMWPYRKKWALNEEFFLDNQQASWNPNLNRIERNAPRAPGQPKAPKTQFNVFKPIIITAAARFLSTHPQLLIKSGSGDKDAVDSARVAQRIVGQYEWSRQDMPSVLAEAIPGLLLHGTTILKTEWNQRARYAGKRERKLIGEDGLPVQAMRKAVDTTTGQMVDEPAWEEDGYTPKWEPERDEYGDPIEEDYWEGEIETCVIPAQEFLVDPTATTWKRRSWCMQVSPRSPAWVYDKYEVSVAPDGEMVDAEQSSGMAMASRFWRRADIATKTVLVKELWIEPGRYRYGSEPHQVFTFPRGYVVVVAGGKVLSHGPNPYDHGRTPFIFIPAIRCPRELWGDTIANSLRVAQVSINKTAGSIQQANDLCANPQWLLPNDVRMPAIDMQATPGLHKRFEPQPHGIIPTLQPGQPIAHSVFAYLEWVMNVIQIISGQHEGGLQGGAPVGVEAGVALEAIAERDTSRLAVTAQEIGRGIREWGELTLKLWQQFKRTEQTVSVTGRFMETEVLTFSGSNVTDKMDVSVAPDSVMPSSRAAKFQKAITLFNLMDELGRRGISLRELKRRIGEDTPEFMSREQVEIANARKENRDFLVDGYTSTTDAMLSVEDQLIHLEEHQLALIDPQFREKPEAWEALYVHFKKHEMLLEMQRQAAMMQAMAVGGGPPQSAGGPPTAGNAPPGVLPPLPPEPSDPAMTPQTAAASGSPLS